MESDFSSAFVRGSDRQSRSCRINSLAREGRYKYCLGSPTQRCSLFPEWKRSRMVVEVGVRGAGEALALPFLPPGQDWPGSGVPVWGGRVCGVVTTSQLRKEPEWLVVPV